MTDADASGPRVVLTWPFFEDVVARELAGHDVVVAEGDALDDALGHAEGLCTLLSVRVNDDLLARAPGLRVVGNFAVGLDNIDLDACRARGVAVVNTPDVLTRATAELTVALVLACARRLGEGERMCRAGAFDGWAPEMLLGKQLDGATAVLVGAGRIGLEAGRLLSGLGLVVEHITRDDDAHVVTDKLGRADVLSLHIPLREDTRHWLTRARIARLKPDCIVVNTARGPIVDEDALIDALTEKRLFGAGLDVYEAEPHIPARLLALDNVVLAPHIGSATLAARKGMARLALSGIAAVLRGQSPPNRVV